MTKPGFINSDIFRLYLKPIIGEIKIKDLKRTFINATDLIQGETFVFSGDDYLLDLLLLLVLFRIASPFKKMMNYFSDGGILNNFPTNLIKDKCDKLIGVYVAPLQDVKTIN